MNGAEHFREAEVALRYAWSGDASDPELSIGTAQVHATLALAAATALQPREFLTTDYRDQIALPWLEVAG